MESIFPAVERETWRDDLGEVNLTSYIRMTEEDDHTG